MKIARYIFMVVILSLLLSYIAVPTLAENKTKYNNVKKTTFNEKAPEYKLLFFRNDDRIWIIMPRKTTFVLVFRSFPGEKGYIKCINSKGETLAIDRSFEGDVIISNPVKRPSLRKGKLVVTRYDGDAIGFFTPENAAYIEVLNSKNGYDGVVTVMDRKKRILCRQSGLDIQIIDYRLK